jgi:GNAT superfamily N-acetyltransferase
MKVGMATLQECREIINILCEHYLKETIFTSMTYDHALTVKKVYEWIASGSCLVIQDKSKIVGLCVVEIGNTFYVEPEADIAMFYIMPEYRATEASRLIRDAAIQFAKTKGAALIYSLSGSGISDRNDNLYCNLWRRAGLQKLGTCMIGVLNG